MAARSSGSAGILLMKLDKRPLVDGPDSDQVLAQPAAHFLRPLQRRFHVLFGDPLGSNQQVAQSHGSHRKSRYIFFGGLFRPAAAPASFAFPRVD